MSIEQISRLNPSNSRAAEMSEFQRLQDTVIFAIRDREWDTDGQEAAEAHYEQLMARIKQAENLGDLFPKEVTQLMTHVDALRTTDQEVWRRVMLEHDRVFLQKNKPDLYEQAVLDHIFRRENGVGRSCSHLQFDTWSRCARCTKGTQEGCTQKCPARPNDVAPQESAEMVA
ncbi:MAG: hypothetical protein PHI23_01970 [Candidatus Peribacteraceae bacterium]|nr:hypothetical protein [Candidatus Peribacteraceae bacterium]